MAKSGSSELQAKWPILMRGADASHEMVRSGSIEATYRFQDGKKNWSASVLEVDKAVPLMPSELERVVDLFNPLERDGSLGRPRFLIAVQRESGQVEAYNWHLAFRDQGRGAMVNPMLDKANALFRVDPDTRISQIGSPEDMLSAKTSWLNEMTFGQEHSKTSAMAAAITAGLISAARGDRV